jgi:hypothetical protein
VSKRHQSSRRKSYGRRQHEIAERRQQRDLSDDLELDLFELVPSALGDRFSDHDAAVTRMQFAMGD